MLSVWIFLTKHCMIESLIMQNNTSSSGFNHNILDTGQTTVFKFDKCLHVPGLELEIKNISPVH